MDIWYAHAALQNAIQFSFIQKLRMLCPYWLKLYGHFLVCSYIGAVIDVAKRTAAQLSRQSVFAAHA